MQKQNVLTVMKCHPLYVNYYLSYGNLYKFTFR